MVKALDSQSRGTVLLTSSQPFILLGSIKWVRGISGNLVAKIKLPPHCSSVALGQLNPIHKKGPQSFLKSNIFFVLDMCSNGFIPWKRRGTSSFCYPAETATQWRQSSKFYSKQKIMQVSMETLITYYLRSCFRFFRGKILYFRAKKTKKKQTKMVDFTAWRYITWTKFCIG